MNKIFVNNIGDLAEAQRASFYRFLSIGLTEELSSFPNPFITKIRILEITKRKIPCLVYIYPQEIKLKGPNLNIDSCLKKDLSYTVQLYVASTYSNYFTLKYCNSKSINKENKLFLDVSKKEKLKKIIYIKQDIFFGEIPLMTEEGTFIVTGCERIVISQIIRSPGVYFRKEFGTTRKLLYTATIISNKGLWTKFILDKKQKTIKYKKKENDETSSENKIRQHFITIQEFKKKCWEKYLVNKDSSSKKNLNSESLKHEYEDFLARISELLYYFSLINKITKLIDQAKNQNLEDRIYLKKYDGKTKTEDNENKLFIGEIINYFGLNIKEVFDGLKYKKHFLRQSLFINKKYNQDELLRHYENFYIYIPMCKSSKEFNDYVNSIKKYYYDLKEHVLNIHGEDSLFVKRIFFNQRSGCFSIGEIGRYKINQKLGLNLPKSITYLTAHDFLGIIDGLTKLKYYQGLSDDIDDIKNKQIRCIGELLQIQIRVGLYRLRKNLIENIGLLNTQKYALELENFTDPTDWILDPRLITQAVKEFFKTSQLSQLMDQVNPLSELTHKRRISVFGPNGLKRDHISTVIRDIHPSQYGRLCPIETPEGQNAGLITSVSMFGRLSDLGSIETPYFLMENSRVFSEKQPIFLNPEQESITEVAFCDISLKNTQFITNEYVSVKSNCQFSVQKTKKLNFITTSPLQIISLATSLIPFLEHNDANRALMGANMQRQAVPLLYTQKPIIGTGLEATAILDSGMIIKSYSQGKVEFSSSSFIKIKDLSNQVITYYLRKYYRSNQETSFNQRPIVWAGEEVFSGQIIADGPGTNDGELSLGKNLTIAYMPWEGYNYEDAIVINERLILDDCLTSVHIEEHETSLAYYVTGSEFITKDLPRTTNYNRRHLNEDGIVKRGSYVKEQDILVGKLTPCEEDSSAEAKFVRALHGHIKEEPTFRDTSLRVPHGSEGRVIEVRLNSVPFITKDEQPDLSTSCQMIRIYIAQIRKIQVGDKLAGRHGNKGIISRILPQQDMPYLPDGTPIDIIFNPLGVPSRMNVGQILECLLGFAGEKLGTRFKISPFDEVYGEEASRILVNQKLKEASLKTNCNWIFNPYYPGKILLRDGRTGEYFDNPITVGKSYILKLVHLVEDKIHARATGPYSMITEQPLAGKSQKGGQRFGEMEVWALEAYGCSNTLQELLTIKSDDIDGRNDMYESILLRNEIEKPTPSIPESFLALIRELQALGLDFTINKIEGGFDSTTATKVIEKDIFKELEIRLKLRALLIRKKAEQFAKSRKIMIETNEEIKERIIKEENLNNEKQIIIENFKNIEKINKTKE